MFPGKVLFKKIHNGLSFNVQFNFTPAYSESWLEFFIFFTSLFLVLIYEIKQGKNNNNLLLSLLDTWITYSTIRQIF